MSNYLLVTAGEKIVLTVKEKLTVFFIQIFLLKVTQNGHVRIQIYRGTYSSTSKKFEYFRSKMTTVLIIVLQVSSRQVSICVIRFLSSVRTLFELADQFLYELHTNENSHK